MRVAIIKLLFYIMIAYRNADALFILGVIEICYLPMNINFTTKHRKASLNIISMIPKIF